MKPIIQFAVIFVLTYATCLLLYQTKSISGMTNRFFKSMSTTWIRTIMPSVDISSQEVDTKNMNSSDMYLVYGNPVLIQKAKEEAKRTNQIYATVPTKSMLLHLFEMFIVPFFFLISLFVATPLNWKGKLKGMFFSILLLFIFILIKLFCLCLFEISNARIGVYELGDSGMNILSTLLGIFSLGLSLTLAFVTWLIFGFQKSGLVVNIKKILVNK